MLILYATTYVLYNELMLTTFLAFMNFEAPSYYI